MAWHIPQELMNNNPLSKNEVEERYKKYCKNNNIDLIRLKYSDFEKKEKYKIILKNKFLC